jgi:SAM-dependent methyltransferase
MGQDTLSWARRGATVTGLDFSDAAIRTARALAEDIGMTDHARFIVSDVYEAPTALNGECFDIVYTGLGALVWLPDLLHWAHVVSSLLHDGGILYLAEFHPLTDMLGEDGRSMEQDYFHVQAETYDFPHTYTDGPLLAKTLSVQWQHQLGDVVTALAQAGLRIEFLHEHATTLFQRYPMLERSGTGEYRFPPGQPRIPLMYSIRAAKTA